jgi:hypothetical protein
MVRPHYRSWRPIFIPIYRTKPMVNIQKENQLKGFSFTSDCTGFVITNPRKAFRWAYDLGLGWNPENGNVYEWLYSFFDPSSACMEYFKQNYEYMSRKDALFYVKLIVSYFRGLLKGEFIDRQWLLSEWRQFRINMINKFGLSATDFPVNL